MVTTNSLAATSMNVQVSGRHIAVGDALRSRIVDELVGAVGKYLDRKTGSAEVVISKDGHSFCADIVALLGSGQQLVARGLGGDAHSAFDAALTKFQSRLRRYKKRLVDHHPHNGRIPAENAPYTVIRATDEADDEDDGWDGATAHLPPAAMVIAETEAPVKTMTVSMAVMDLDLTEAPALVFRNAAHGGLSVVYRRADGNIGWIDPERTRTSAPAAAE
jgi:ribosomal subunit interface protein